MKTQCKPAEMYHGFEVHVINELDGGMEFKVEPENYKGCTPEEIEKYCEQDRARLEAFSRGEWYYLQLGIELRVKTSANWAVPTTIGRAYLSGVETDSGSEYIESVLEDLKHEALADARLTFAAMRGILAPCTCDANVDSISTCERHSEVSK